MADLDTSNQMTSAAPSLISPKSSRSNMFSEGGKSKQHQPTPQEKLEEISVRLAEVRKKRAEFDGNKKPKPQSRSSVSKKKSFHHPKLEYVMAEVVYSPYMTKPNEHYSQETFRIPEKLRELKKKSNRIQTLPKEEQPFEFKEIRGRFMDEVANYNVSFAMPEDKLPANVRKSMSVRRSMLLEDSNSGKSQGSISSIRNSKSQGLPTVKGSSSQDVKDDSLSHDLRHALYLVNTEFKEIKEELESVSADTQPDSAGKTQGVLPELSPRGGGVSGSFAVAGGSSRPSSSTSKRAHFNEDKAQDKMPQISPRPIPSRQASGSVLVPPSESKQTSPRLLEPLQSKESAAERKTSPRDHSQSKEEDFHDFKDDEYKIANKSAEGEYEEDGFVSPIKANPTNSTNHNMEDFAEETDADVEQPVEAGNNGCRPLGDFDETKQLFDPTFFADDDSVRNDNSVIVENANLPNPSDNVAPNVAAPGGYDELDEEEDYYGNENYEEVVKSVLDDIQTPEPTENKAITDNGFEPEDDYLDDDYQPLPVAGPITAFEPVQAVGDGDEPSYEADFNTTGIYDDDFDEGGDAPAEGPQSKSVSMQNSRYQLLNPDEDR